MDGGPAQGLRCRHHSCDRRVQQLEAEVDFGLGHRERRRDPHHAAGGAGAHDVGAEPELQRRVGHRVRERRRGACRRRRRTPARAAGRARARRRCRRGAAAAPRRPAASRAPSRLARAARPSRSHDLEHLQPDRGRQRIVDMRGVEQEVARVSASARSRRWSSRPPAAGRRPSVFESMRMSGTTPSRSKANISAGAPHAGLRLVQDQQHAARAAMRLERGEIARRQLDHAAAAQDRLGDEGGEIAGALPVQQVEARRRAPARQLDAGESAGDRRSAPGWRTSPTASGPMPRARPCRSPTPRRRSCRARIGRSRRPPTRR